MKNNKTLVLNNVQIQQKLNRMAYQIYEHNFSEKSIVIAGIADRGYILAERLSKILSEISSISIQLAKVTVDKENPVAQPVLVSLPAKSYTNKVIVLVDDVLNSGKALIYGVAPFISVPVKRITTVVLVDRNHNRYPIKADFVGLSLATTLQEHISVELDKNGRDAVYLL